MVVLKPQFRLLAQALGLVLAGLLAWWAYRTVSAYFEGRGRLEVLEQQNGELVGAARTLNARLDSVRAVGDTIGQGAAAANVAERHAIEALGNAATPLREIIVERRDTIALKLDSLRLEQIASYQRVVELDSVRIRTLELQLLEERRFSDEALANRDEQIVNLRLQVETATSMLPGGFFSELLDDPIALVVGGAVGAAACYAWCPRDRREDARPQYSIELGRFSTPF